MWSCSVPVCIVCWFLSVATNLFQALQEQFAKFRNDTLKTGDERVQDANKVADNLIDQHHSDAVTIAAWKDNINDKWADVQELIKTRVMVST